MIVESMAAVDGARATTPLTYFEFTTLAVLHRFAQAGLDAAILEIGLGGRLDAVNIVDADCALLTAIDLDHTELLGASREQVGSEKAHIFRAGRAAICSDPRPPASVASVARGIGADLWLAGRDFSFDGDAAWASKSALVASNGRIHDAMLAAIRAFEEQHRS